MVAPYRRGDHGIGLVEGGAAAHVDDDGAGLRADQAVQFLGGNGIGGQGEGGGNHGSNLSWYQRAEQCLGGPPP